MYVIWVFYYHSYLPVNISEKYNVTPKFLSIFQLELLSLRVHVCSKDLPALMESDLQLYLVQFSCDFSLW